MKEFLLTVKDVHKLWARDYYTQIGVMDKSILEAMIKTDGGVAISYSGGKDSGMLLDRAGCCWRLLYGDSRPMTVIFANTGCEFATMWPFVQRFVRYIMDKYHIVIDLRKVSAKQPFSRTVKDVGYPFPSKKIARMVSDVRVQMDRLGVTYKDIRPYVHAGIVGAQAMREMGFSPAAVCDVTGVKSDDQPGTCVISRVWTPLLGAPFEVTNLCCSIHKKGPIKAMEREMGGLVPMIGEMAANSKTRMDAYRRTGCNVLSGDKRVSKPMGPMTEQTVNEYYYRTHLPLAPPYGDPVREGACEQDYTYRYSGEQNTGCKLCGFGIMYDWDRFARLAKMEPETVRWAFRQLEDDGLGYTDVCKYINAECHGKINIPQL